MFPLTQQALIVIFLALPFLTQSADQSTVEYSDILDGRLTYLAKNIELLKHAIDGETFAGEQEVVAKATLSYLDGRPNDGIALLEPFLKPSSHVGVYCIYAMCLSAANNDHKAIKVIEKKNKAAGGDSRLYSMLARIHFLRNDMASCQSAATRSIKLNPKDADAYCFRAACYWQNKELGLALKDCNLALEIRPYGPIRNEEKPFLIKAACLQNDGKPDQAARVFEKAIEFAPNSIKAHYGIWSSLAQLGRYNDALKHANTLKKLAPDSPFSLRTSGITLALIGEFERAERLLKEWAEVDRQNAEAYRLLATVYLKNDKPDEALAVTRTARKISSKEPLNRFAYVEAAHAVLQQQRNMEQPIDRSLLNEAVSMIEKLCEETSWLQPSFVNLAVYIYQLSDQPQKANEAIQKARLAKATDL